MRPNLTVLLIVILSLFCATSASAQKIKFCDTSNTWLTTGGYGTDCEWDRTGRLTVDTLISGQVYKKFRYASTKMKKTGSGCNADAGKGFYIREDQADGMVYYRTPYMDNQEHVLYNYNLNVGDTIQYSYSIYPGGSVADSLVNIDSILIGGVYHRVFDFQNVAGRGYRAYTVIEGVGCVNHPLYPAFAGACNSFFENLRCFSQSGLVQDFSMRLNSCTTLGNSFYINCNYIPTTTGLTGIAATDKSGNIYPNPAGSDFYVRYTPAHNGSISVAAYDLSGRCIYRENHTPSQQPVAIKTSSWKNGSYMVAVRDNGNLVQKEMIVINH